MQDKKIAITGGAGFIGSNLARELAENNEVIVIDDLSTGRIGNIAELRDMGKITFIKGSILDQNILQKAFKKVDFVFHLAALPSVAQSIAEPIPTNEVNITGTLKVLITARDSGVKKVVFASSSAVYGDTPTLKKKEDKVARPESPYALTKMVGEYYCHIFLKVYGLNTICLRYFNVYGPGQNPDSAYAAVVPRFITDIHQDKSPVIYGDGNQTRDFVFVQDAIQANIKAAESDASGIFNVGTGRITTINQLAENIMKIMGKSLPITYLEPRAGDIRNSLADLTNARLIGYQPRYSLKDGLRMTIEKS